MRHLKIVLALIVGILVICPDLPAQVYTLVTLNARIKNQALIGSDRANELTIAGANASSGPSITATGSDTNVDIVVTPKGSGRITSSKGLTVTGTIIAGTGPTTLTDAAGKLLSASMNTVGVAQGGTGTTTLTQDGVLYGNAASAVGITAQGAANTVLTANAGAPIFSATPTVASLTTTGATVVGTTRTVGVGASTAAAGTTTADAGVLPAGTASIYPTTAADGTTGVRVNAADQVTGRLIFIGNGVSTAILKVYAPSGGTINGAAGDAAFSSVSGKGVIIACLDSAGNTWLAW